MTHNKPKPDDRSDNVEKLQDMIQNTEENINEANATMEFAAEHEVQNIKAKNKRREKSIDAMKSEVQDETQARENGFQ